MTKSEGRQRLIPTCRTCGGRLRLQRYAEAKRFFGHNEYRVCEGCEEAYVFECVERAEAQLDRRDAKRWRTWLAIQQKQKGASA